MNGSGGGHLSDDNAELIQTEQWCVLTWVDNGDKSKKVNFKFLNHTTVSGSSLTQRYNRDTIHSPSYIVHA